MFAKASSVKTPDIVSRCKRSIFCCLSGHKEDMIVDTSGLIIVGPQQISLCEILVALEFFSGHFLQSGLIYNWEFAQQRLLFMILTTAIKTPSSSTIFEEPATSIRLTLTGPAFSPVGLERPYSNP